jgi:hypothetical protein
MLVTWLTAGRLGRVQKILHLNIYRYTIHKRPTQSISVQKNIRVQKTLHLQPLCVVDLDPFCNAHCFCLSISYGLLHTIQYLASIGIVIPLRI